MPTLSTTAHARDPKFFPQPDPEADAADKKNGLSIEDLLTRMNDAQHEKLFNAVQKVNDRVFKSRPAGAPVAKSSGSWSFTVLGDYGSGRPAYKDVVKNIIANDSSLVLSTGDNVYYNANEGDWQKKWDPYMPALTKVKRFMPTLGDHDIRSGPSGYFKRFPELNGARYYAFSQGGVRFFNVDTNEALQKGSMQHEWLERELAASKEKWKVISLHHPLWSSVPSKRNRDNLAPLLAKYGVDLVFGGHEHWYNRSKPLNEAGTVQIVTGTGGESLVPFFLPQEKWSAHRQARWGHVEVEVTNDALVGRYILRDKSVADTFVIPDNAATGASQAAGGAAALGASTTLA
jgi:hypothetical protein